MKLAFSGQARYPEFDEGYDLYINRSRSENYVDRRTYCRVIREYCRLLADAIFTEGQVDLPCDMGTIAAAKITRNPQYRGKQFLGFGAYDYKTGTYDGQLRAFGMVYLPRHGKNNNLRCFGFVANRKLFMRMKKTYDEGNQTWVPIFFDKKMI